MLDIIITFIAVTFLFSFGYIYVAVIEEND